MSNKIDEPEGFGAVPRRLLNELAMERIDLLDFALLAFLIVNENPHNGIAFAGSTSKLAEAVGWELSEKYLRDKLNKLRRGGYIDHTMRSGARTYEIRLGSARARRWNEAGTRQVAPVPASSEQFQLEDRPAEDGQSVPEAPATGAVPASKSKSQEQEQEHGLYETVVVTSDQDHVHMDEGQPEEASLMKRTKAEVEEAMVEVRRIWASEPPKQTTYPKRFGSTTPPIAVAPPTKNGSDQDG